MMLPIDRAVVNRPERDQEGHVPDARGLEEYHERRQARRKEDYTTALTALRSSASPKTPSFSSPRPFPSRLLLACLALTCDGERRMKPLDRQSEIVFRKLTEGLNKVGDCRKVDGSTMVELVRTNETGAAHLDHQVCRTAQRPHCARDGRSLPCLKYREPSRATSWKDTDERIYPVSYRRSGLRPGSPRHPQRPMECSP